MRFVWNQAGGLAECPYFHWSAAMFGRFSIRLHHWHSNDDARAHHDHPHWFITVVLWGAYTDISTAPDGSEIRDRLTLGSIRFRPAAYRHTVQEIVPGTLTLLLTGPTKFHWGFWVNGKRIMRDKYFATKGHHPCEVGQEAVRQRPDGTRIGKSVHA